MILESLLLSICVANLVNITVTSEKVCDEGENIMSQPVLEDTTEPLSLEDEITDTTLDLNETEPYNVLRIGDANDTASETFDPTKHPNWKMFNENMCGSTVSFRTSFAEGNDAEFAEFPWIALLGFQVNDSEELHYECQGVLVNKRYVLTTAQCTKIGVPEYTLKTVRFGEYDLSTNPDCLASECALSIQEIIPEEVVLHAGYNETNHMGHNIALIRLRKAVEISRYINTICMMHGSALRRNYTGEEVTIAGWGLNERECCERSDRLQFLEETIASNALCKARLGDQLNVTDSDICVQIEKGEDTCARDLGGPAMYMNLEDIPSGYYVIGLLSLGSENCDDESSLALATRVSSHMKWILDNVRI